MFIIAVLALALPSTLAQLTTPAPHLDPAKPCCEPEKYEGLVYNFLSEETESIHVDWSIKKIFSNTSAHAGWMMADLGAGKEYIHNGTHCTIIDIRDLNLFKRCMPDDAVYIGSAHFGPIIQGLEYNAFQMIDHQGNLTLAVSQDSCLPILASLVSDLFGKTVRVFINLAEQIQDPSVFNPDLSSCVHAPVVPVPAVG